MADIKRPTRLDIRDLTNHARRAIFNRLRYAARKRSSASSATKSARSSA